MLYATVYTANIAIHYVYKPTPPLPSGLSATALLDALLEATPRAGGSRGALGDARCQMRHSWVNSLAAGDAGETARYDPPSPSNSSSMLRRALDLGGPRGVPLLITSSGVYSVACCRLQPCCRRSWEKTSYYFGFPLPTSLACFTLSFITPLP